jgi:hypothetical protein
MYRSVYWHKGVRSATAMIKKAVFMALNAGILSPENLYGLDDDGFYSLLRSIDYPPFALATAVFEGRIYGTVLDLPFSELDERHRSLLDLNSRQKIEEALAAEAGGGLGNLDIVIDVPEAVSFETNLPVLLDVSDRCGDERCALPFPESSTVFTPPVIAGFARSLRRVRVFARENSSRLEEAAQRMFG